jgi:hypothetical protein
MVSDLNPEASSVDKPAFAASYIAVEDAGLGGSGAAVVLSGGS